MKKIIILVGIGVVIVGTGWYLRNQLTQKAEISQTLSSRSKEYLEKVQHDSTDQLQSADVNQTTQQKNLRVTVGDCFSFVVPYPIQEIKPNEHPGECTQDILLANQKGNIVAFQKNGSFSTLNDISSVSLFRQRKDTYTEIDKTINGREFAIFNQTGTEQYLSFTFTQTSYTVINFLVIQGENTEKDLEATLATVELKKT